MGKLIYIIPGLAGLLFAYWLAVVTGLIPYVIIAVASVIPPAICFVAASRVPRLVLPLIYLLCSAAMVWFLDWAGDDMMPSGIMIYNRRSSIEASSDFLAAWTGLMLALYGVTAVCIMISAARDRWRKARLPKTGTHPGSRRARLDGGRSSRHRSKELP